MGVALANVSLQHGEKERERWSFINSRVAIFKLRSARYRENGRRRTLGSSYIGKRKLKEGRGKIFGGAVYSSQRQAEGK